MMNNKSEKRRLHWNEAQQPGLAAHNPGSKVRQTRVCCEGDDTPLKELPLSLQEKWTQREKQTAEGRQISGWDWKQNQRLAHRKLSQETHNILSAWKLWKKPLHEIEGCFGSGCVSYFILLRFLFFLNFIFVPLFAGFVLVPTSFFNKTPEVPAVETLNQTTDIQCKNFSYRTQGAATQTEKVFLDIFTGEGILETSFLFYGHYRFLDTMGLGYSIRMAYLLTILGYLILCFLWVGRRMVASRIQRQWHSRYYLTAFSSRIFAGWDFCVRDMDAVSLKQHSISNCLKMELQEVSRHQQKQQQSGKEKAVLTLIRLLLNALILALTSAAFYCIYLATEVSQDFEQNRSSTETFSRRVVTQYLPPIIISLVNFFLPYVFGALVRYEGYSPSVEVNLTLLRSVLLKLAGLGMFLFSLGQKVLCVGNRDDSNCLTCGYNKLYQCWETSIGQEMYKMTVFNFLSTIGVTLLVSLPRRLMVDHTSWKLAQWIGKEEFLIPQNILDIVYEQTVIWCGMFYSPLLPLLNCVFLFIIFYVKKYTLCHICKPSKRMFRASSSRFFFQFILFLGLMMALCPLTYIITKFRPSRACGLFVDYATAWQVVHESISTRLPVNAQRFLNYIGSEAFAFPLLTILCLVLIAYISRIAKNRETIEQLKNLVVMQAWDKSYLEQELSKVLKETWLGGSNQTLQTVDLPEAPAQSTSPHSSLLQSAS
ncbi:transmembrane channel-like protein 8 isoform X2 [Microcaecilia unicolor]|uniref:Transmembrane channel-like protein n=1 Tax=Microcaecilia unicolor TaxID=1415580 RepID=A0A6P7YMW6_9AMPH|nr:transmembrane channel-like protein 8 isoform X2 [Microcaecilia unicolor]